MTLNIDDLSDLGKKGVYRILNICNGKMYIGSTVDSFKTRFRTHINKMRTNKHPNTHLQGAYNKYGEENFEFSILYFGESLNDIRDKEQEYINTFDVCNKEKGYNLDPDVYRKLRNEQTNKQISETLKRKYASGEIVAQHRECQYKGKKRPEYGMLMRGRKISILVSDIQGTPIATFRGQLDIQEYTTNNIIPGIQIGPHSIKGYYISIKMVSKYVNTGKPYKGLLFTKVRPLPPEMGAVKWENCWNGEIPNQQPSLPLTKQKGPETNS